MGAGCSGAPRRRMTVLEVTPRTARRMRTCIPLTVPEPRSSSVTGRRAA